MLLELAWRNIWRQTYRTALTLSSIALTCAITVFLLALQRGTYGIMEENALHVMDGFAQIQPRGYADDPDIRKTIGASDTLMQRLATLGVTATPRAASYAILTHGSRSDGAAVFGVDPQRELQVSSLGRLVKTGRYLHSEDSDDAVIGAGLARNLQLQVGQQFTLLGGARDGSVAADVLTVVGIFSSGSNELDRQVVEVPLKRFQATFSMDDRVNTIALATPTLTQMQSTLPGIRKVAGSRNLAVRDWTQLEPALHDAILLDASFSSLIYVTLIAVVVFILLNTLLMSVLERTREFGMLMAVGMHTAKVGAMVWIELLLLTGCGTLLGMSVGVAVTAWFAIHGIPVPSAEALFSQWHMPSSLQPRLDLTSATTGPLVIAASIVIAGLVPYLRVRRLRPVTAMRAT